MLQSVSSIPKIRDDHPVGFKNLEMGNWENGILLQGRAQVLGARLKAPVNTAGQCRLFHPQF